MKETTVLSILNIALCIVILILTIWNSKLNSQIKSISIFINMDIKYIEKRLKTGFTSDKDEFIFSIRLKLYDVILRLLKD